MNYYYEDGFYYIEHAGEKRWIAVEQSACHLIAVDEELHASAWDRQTGQPACMLESAAVLQTADKEESILVSKDMQAILKIKDVYYAHVIHDRLIVAERRTSYFSSSVYRLEHTRIHGAEWKEETAQCHTEDIFVMHSDSVFSAVIRQNGRIRKILITPRKTIFSFPADMEFGRSSGDIVPFSQNREIGLYDFRQEQELCRFEQKDDTEQFFCVQDADFRNGPSVWMTPYRFYKDGKVQFLWEDRTAFRASEPQKTAKFVCMIDNAENSCLCRLINLQTGKLSSYYESAKPASGTCILVSSSDKKSGIIDKDFNEILPVFYDEILYSEKHDLFLLKKENQYGIAKSDGTLLIPAVWDNIRMLCEHFTACMAAVKNNKETVLLPDGSLLTLPEWNSAQIIGFQTVCLWKYLPKDDTQEQQKYFALIHTDTKETLLEGVFDSIQPFAGECLKIITAENKTGIFSICEKRWLSEPELCSADVEGDRIVVQTLVNPERKEFRID